MSALCDIVDVRRYLGLEGSAHDALLGRLVAAVGAEIETWCDQPILARAIVYRFAGNGGARVVLPYFPVVSVDALTYTTSITGDTVTVDADAFTDVRGWLVGSFSDAYEYELTLTVGYADVPKDVEQVAIEMVALRALDSLATGIGLQRLGKRSEGKSVGGGSATTMFERPDWQARLAPYRRVTI